MNRKTKNIKNKVIQFRGRKHCNLLKLLFVKNLLKNGKTYLATRIINKTLFLLEQKFQYDSLKILEEAVYNSKIDFNLKSLTANVNSLQIPIEIDSYRAINIGIKNIIALAKQHSTNSLSERLFSAILESFYKKGSAVQKRKENLQIAQKYKINLYDELI